MSTYGDSVRSPLEQVWRQFVPQGYDQALRNAFYNVAAIVFVGCVAAAAWSVYMIFQPFVQPLLWAVLCGSLLHPAKHWLTTWTRGWLSEVQHTHGLLSLSLALLPLRLLDTISEMVGRFVVRHVRSVVTVTVILPLVYMVIHHTPTFLSSLAYTIVSSLFCAISTLVTVVANNAYVALALVCGYVGAVVFCWSDRTTQLLTRLSVAMWLVAAAGLSGLWPAGSVGVFILLCLLLVAGLCTEVMDVHAALKASREDATIIEAILMTCQGQDTSDSKYEGLKQGEHGEEETVSGLSPVPEEVVEDVGGSGSPSQLSTIPEVSPASSEDHSLREEATQGSPPQQEGPASTPESPTAAEARGKQEEAETQQQGGGKDESVAGGGGLQETPRPQVLLSPALTVPSRALPTNPLLSPTTTSSASSHEDNGSNMYLKGVFVSCILVELWQHNYLLPLLPIAMLYYFLKKIASRYLAWSLKNGNVVSDMVRSVQGSLAAFLAARRSALLPPPIKGVIKLLVRTDGQVVVALCAAVDALITLLLILAVIFFAVTASIYLAVQIQAESMALVTLGSQVINSTVVNNPQFLQLLPEGLGDVVSSALDEGYLYGREWIASMVRGMLGESDEAKAVQLEKQVVELWDRVYQAWVTAHPQAPVYGPVVTSEAVSLTFDSIVEGLRKTPGVVSFSFMSEVVRDNLGTVVSVLDSVWSILLGNLSLAISALTAAASLLLGGSLSLLNALISVVIFMSSLFYVLSASGPVYKPVAVLANLAPGQMNHLGKAVEDAVNGVFIASLKMGAFYGMWTWLLHSLFSTNIVYIPSVLGAIFGAVPLVGTYWAALPGALELFWSQGSATLALLLVGAQLLPMSCVDTAIYADIKGGSHPYLTGLAVAGGIFYWGAEGAVLGPMLLCILKVATNMYSTLIQSPADFTRRFGKLRRSHSEANI